MQLKASYTARNYVYGAASWKGAAEKDLEIMREIAISVRIPVQPKQPNSVELSLSSATSLQLTASMILERISRTVLNLQIIFTFLSNTAVMLCIYFCSL